MRTLPGPLEAVDVRITQWMARHGVVILRVALGVVFLWFGALKFFPNSAPPRRWRWTPLTCSPSASCPGG